jgi:hypothetical protein
MNPFLTGMMGEKYFELRKTMRKEKNDAEMEVTRDKFNTCYLPPLS